MLGKITKQLNNLQNQPLRNLPIRSGSKVINQTSIGNQGNIFDSYNAKLNNISKRVNTLQSTPPFNLRESGEKPLHR